MSIEELNQLVKQKLSHYKGIIKRPAKGKIPYDYLVPGGPYNEQWDWDAFFMGVALSADISSEAIYLKNWSLNYIMNAQPNGKIAGCVTPDGADPRLNQMKPFLAQGTYLAGVFLKDFNWIKPHWNELKKIVFYRERNLWNKKYDLGVWFDSMESGADNNVAALNFPNKSVIATDLNTFIYQEYKALSLVAINLGYKNDFQVYKERAGKIKHNINKYLWNSEESIYYNLDAYSESHIKRISYSCFLPLWAKIAPKQSGETMINEYLLSKKHMFSNFGIRTLSKADVEYNNVNMIKPHSNWQGPIWPIANYI
ncbi:MAG TPA: trehalase family glycosidase, partial [Candidatus Nitrosocosmicus sp.]|nr:trehalase family glycosidase [Candidatus Nitrosocosmicus sp.]